MFRVAHEMRVNNHALASCARPRKGVEPGYIDPQRQRQRAQCNGRAAAGLARQRGHHVHIPWVSTGPEPASAVARGGAAARQ
eukprot:5365462-Amphidinium_carterae.1